MERDCIKPRIIEFYGLPGSGKTTIARLLGHELDSQRIQYRYYRYKFHRHPYSVLLSPAWYSVVLHLWRYSRNYKAKKPLVRSLSPVHYFRMYNHYLRDCNDGYLILDEGLLQMIVSLSYEESLLVNDAFLDVLKSLNLNEIPLVLVNCCCQSDLCAQRISFRGPHGGRLDELQREDVEKTLHTQEINFNLLTDAVKFCYPQLQIINIDGTLPADINARQIAKLLNLY